MDVPLTDWRSRIRLVAIGTSAGGVEALEELVPAFGTGARFSVLVVQHLSPSRVSQMSELLARRCELPVREIEDKEPVMPGVIHLAPPNYHVLVEDDRSFALDMGEKVNFARPSIDVAFESASEVYGSNMMGVILTGANADGARGLGAVRRRGGVCLVQDPEEAQSPAMPRSAIRAVGGEVWVFSLAQIARVLVGLCRPDMVG